ncbi:MAG: hypothetical protein HYT08_04910 [Candidatus Levybacteria bacterium]|nr:hypothetical protein [Candidatus Levybacteria bacterium]
MNKKGVIGEILETGGSMAQKSAKAVSKTASATVKATASQITGRGNLASDKDIVKNLYGINDDKKNINPGSITGSQQAQQQKQNQDTTSVEDKQKLMELRKKLHDEVYYDPLVNSKKPTEEERPAEKVEKEKQEEVIEIQKKERKKPPPLAIQRAKLRVEKFPGRSG